MPHLRVYGDDRMRFSPSPGWNFGAQIRLDDADRPFQDTLESIVLQEFTGHNSEVCLIDPLFVNNVFVEIIKHPSIPVLETRPDHLIHVTWRIRPERAASDDVSLPSPPPLLGFLVISQEHHLRREQAWNDRYGSGEKQEPFQNEDRRELRRKFGKEMGAQLVEKGVWNRWRMLSG